MTKKIKSILVLAFLLNCIPILAQQRIFLPDKKSEWYVYTSQSGKNNDTAKVFQFEKDMLHVSGAETGYISTIKKYSNFHFTLEFKWGEKKISAERKSKTGCRYFIPCGLL